MEYQFMYQIAWNLTSFLYELIWKEYQKVKQILSQIFCKPTFPTPSRTKFPDLKISLSVEKKTHFWFSWAKKKELYFIFKMTFRRKLNRGNLFRYFMKNDENIQIFFHYHESIVYFVETLAFTSRFLRFWCKN